MILIEAEFDFRVLGDGRSASARYANNSNYRNDSLIRKESMWSMTTHNPAQPLTFESVRELFTYPGDQADREG